MIKKLLLLPVFVIMFLQLKAQEDTTINEVVAFHPFHLVNNGIRIDYDHRLWKNHWLQICPQFYASDRSEDEEFRDFKELLGVGVSVYHRMYLGNRQPSLGTYFSYGFTFNHFNLKYDDNNNSNLLAVTNINKYGGDIVIGYQSLAFERLIIDIYAGLGGRYSSRSFKGNNHKLFNEFIYDYGFTGNVIVLGVRLGFGF